MAFEGFTHESADGWPRPGYVNVAVRRQGAGADQILLGLEHGGEECQSLVAFGHRNIEATAAENGASKAPPRGQRETIKRCTIRIRRLQQQKNAA